MVFKQAVLVLKK